MKNLCKTNKCTKPEEGFMKLKYGKKKIWCNITWYKDEKKIDVVHPETGAVILMLYYTDHCPFKIWKIAKDYEGFSRFKPINNVSDSFNGLIEDHEYIYKNGVLKNCGCYCPGNLKYNSIKLF